MRIYISGPITGKDPMVVLENFGAVALAIAGAGHYPINPSSMINFGLSWETYMKISSDILRSGEVDRMVMLEGWEKSKGAVIEWRFAKSAGIPIGYQSIMDEKMYGGE